jgi:carboxyl-terminal processing protease
MPDGRCRFDAAGAPQETLMARRSLLLTTIVILAALLGGVWGGRVMARDQAQQESLERYTRALDLVEQNYAESVDGERLVTFSIRGMLQTLDPHSSYLEARNYKQMREEQRGSFYGLGIVVTKKDGLLTVISPIEDTPAYRLGIRGGDVISHIEGEPTSEISLDAAVDRLKGRKGTQVTITITRIGVEPFDLTITRDEISTKSLSAAFMLQPGVGFVRIKNFTQTTADELDEALRQLKREGMDSLLLDLRGNPGGLLDQAVEVADRFLDEGQLIVYTKGRISDSNQRFVATRPATAEVPLVVLVDKQSASASEIVAGAVQDHDRGLIVGETTWGKGLVQSVFTLKYDAGLALTTAKYYTPSGRCIQREYQGELEDFVDYYDYDTAVQQAPDESSMTETDLGRTVYGGGGIRPDVAIARREPTDLEVRLRRADMYFKFAAHYLAEHEMPGRLFSTSAETLRAFRDMAVEEGIEGSEQEWSESAPELKRRIAEAVVSNAYGLDVAYRIRVEGDPQVRRALELLPRARLLAMRARGEVEGETAARLEEALDKTAEAQQKPGS